MKRRLAGMLCGLWLLGTSLAWSQDLYDYYLGKYPIEQTRLYQQAADALFAEASPDERQQAREEAQAQSYVVYHRTRWHDLANNVAVTRQYRHAIEAACRHYNVPPAMAEGILTWENSGGTQAMSGAACAGMGQMSDAAVIDSHTYAWLRALPATLICRFERVALAVVESVGGAHTSTARSLRRSQAAWQAEAVTWGTQARHRRLVAHAHVRDERMLALCNIEDSVIFMRLLLDAYDDRVDLAIEAYHNGLRNDDDLLSDYLGRVDPDDTDFRIDRAPLYRALRKRHIDYLTLWNDRRCREMLNGLRTMDGDLTTDANRREALGDESDIYVWKVCAAYAAFNASPRQLADLEDRYQGTQEQAETLGWKPSPPWRTLVYRGRSLRFKPEVAGYLEHLQQRLQALVGPTGALSLAPAGPGMAAEVGSTTPQALHALLYSDWLFDRIYLAPIDGSHWHICLNPRFGRDYLPAPGALSLQKGRP